jgi:hypothetical protein
MRRLCMRSIFTKPIWTVALGTASILLATSVVAFAQEPATSPPQSSSPSPGWHSFSSPPEPPANYPQADNPQPNSLPASEPSSPVVPSRLTLPAGTFVTVRVDQMLSSDKNQAGDGFSATLTRPLVAEGVVVAQRGQILGGRVAEAQKAGRVKGVSRLAVQLTDLTLVDGQQVPIETELTNLTGPTSKARDAGAIAGTTALGAAVGAAADLGAGAAIGAGAGLVAGTVGVLLTRGRPTVIYPESVLTFRLSEPIAIFTDHVPQAFRYVVTNEYNRASMAQGPPPPSGWTCKGYGYTWPLPAPPPPPPYYYYPYYYPYPWVAGFRLWYGPGLFYGRGFYGRGFGYRR